MLQVPQLIKYGGMRILIFFLLVTVVSNAVELGAQPREKVIHLFDGKTFKGWEGETKKTWRIEDGALVGGSLTETVAHNEFLSTKRSYSDFVLHVKF